MAPWPSRPSTTFSLEGSEQPMNHYATPLDIIRSRYPNALSTSDTVDAFLDLVQRRLGIEPNKIMLADSICSDDLNTSEYPKRAYEMLCPVKLGVLDGFSFAGTPGFSACEYVLTTV